MAIQAWAPIGLGSHTESNPVSYLSNSFIIGPWIPDLDHDRDHHADLVVGQVVASCHDLAMYPQPPLFGWAQE